VERECDCPLRFKIDGHSRNIVPASKTTTSYSPPDDPSYVQIVGLKDVGNLCLKPVFRQ
jgi:hypothetical protein